MNEESKSRRMTEIAGKIVSGTATPHEEEEYKHIQASYRRDLLDLPAVTRPVNLPGLKSEASGDQFPGQSG